MQDYIYITNDAGEIERIALDELDSEIYPHLWRPIGGFCYSVDSFIHLGLPPVPFYIQNWLPKQGKAMIYAPAKSGKSFLCAQIARCIGVGEDFLGMRTSPGRVLYVQAELGERILQDRLKSTGQEYDNVYIGTSFSMKLDQQAGMIKLVDALEAVKPQVLILDPWYKLINGDENESRDNRVILDFLDSIIETHNCSLLVIHHPGKDISKGGRGSSILEDWVDSYIEMKRVSKQGEPLRVKITPKLYRHAELPPEGIEAEMKNFEFQIVGHSESIADKVLEYALLCGGSFTPKEVLDAGIGTNKSVHTALDELVQSEQLEKVDRGVYKLKEEKSAYSR